MANNLYIDNINAYSSYGVFVADGGYNELAGFASLKNVQSNEWQEEDGEEFDLSAPVLDSRELSIKFTAHGSKYELGAFIELLSDKSYHVFEFRELGRTYKLRLVSSSNLDLAYQLGFVTLRFADDFPLDNYTYKAPLSTIVSQSGYEIDGVSLANYGVFVLQGSLAEVEKSPAVKKNLLRNIASQKGAMYDGKTVTFETKEVKLNCLMRASSLPEFWQNYDALLFDLSKPNERTLYVDATGYEYPCYYKNSSVVSFAPIGKIWFEFSLVLVFTSFRVEADEYLLASEDGEWIVTEDDEYAIDLGEIEI